MDRYRDIDTETTISNDGLRYTAKIPGSEFGPMMLGGYSTIDVVLQVRSPQARCRTGEKILGRNQKVCAVNCRKKA